MRHIQKALDTVKLFNKIIWWFSTSINYNGKYKKANKWDLDTNTVMSNAAKQIKQMLYQDICQKHTNLAKKKKTDLWVN